jgi:hypothetical protein
MIEEKTNDEYQSRVFSQLQIKLHVMTPFEDEWKVILLRDDIRQR